MATLTNEQIAEKKLLLKQLSQQANAIIAELTEAGAWPLNDDELRLNHYINKKGSFHNEPFFIIT